MLLQLPIWLALYHLPADVAVGVPVGAMSPELVASLGAATLLGVPWPSAATSVPGSRTLPWSPVWPAWQLRSRT